MSPFGIAFGSLARISDTDHFSITRALFGQIIEEHVSYICAADELQFRTCIPFEPHLPSCQEIVCAQDAPSFVALPFTRDDNPPGLTEQYIPIGKA